MIQLFANQNNNENKTPIAIFGRRELRPNRELYNRAVEGFGRAYLQKILQIHNAVMKDKVNLSQISDALEFFDEYHKEIKRSYLHSLIFPEKTRGVRVPTKFPIPTLTFTQKNQLTISPNTNGNFLVQWNVQSLFDNTTATPTYSDLWLNVAATLTGATTGVASTSSRANFLNVQNTLNAYRLVSATMIVTYIGSVDAHSGILGGGIDINIATSSGSDDTSLTNFSNVDDKMFSYQSIPFNGLKLNYFPKDYADLNMYRIPADTATSQLSAQGLPSWIKLIVYGQNLAGGSSIRIDFYRNWEAVPATAFSDIVSAQLPTQKEALYNKNQEEPLDVAKKMVSLNAAVMSIPESNQLAQSDLIQAIENSENKSTVLGDFRKFVNNAGPIIDKILPGIGTTASNIVSVGDRALTRFRDDGFNLKTIGQTFVDVVGSEEGLKGTIKKLPEKLLEKIPIIGNKLAQGYRFLADKLFSLF